MKFIGVEQFDVLTKSETVTVGSGERFTTLNAALSFYSKKAPQYLNAGVRLTLSLKAGFTMAEQVLVDGLNLGWITISGADAETTIDRSALTAAPTTFAGIYPAFFVDNGGVLPVIGKLFTMNTSGTSTNRHGIFLTRSSRAIITSGAGVKSAGGRGLAIGRGSFASAVLAVFSGANGDLGVSCSSSIIAANSANARKGETDSSSDFSVDSGGIIVAVSATGGLSQTANTITASGIIFQ